MKKKDDLPQITDMQSCVIRLAEATDIDLVVKCHIEALASDVAPAFGEAFLKRYYESSNQQDSSALLVARKGEIFGGFVLVLTKRQSLATVLDLRSAATFLLNALRNPELYVLMTRQLLQFQPFPDERTAEIAFIAVAEEFRGQGIGRALIKRSGEFALERNMAYLASKTANEALANYYQTDLQAQTVNSVTTAGRRYTMLRWAL